jgi:hypothetical protein
MLIATIADLLWDLFHIVASILRIVYGPDVMEDTSLNCQIYVLFNTGNLRVSNGCIAILAVIRYLIGCCHKKTPSWVWYLVFCMHMSICLGFSLTSFIRWDGRRSSSKVNCLQFLSSDLTSKNLMIAHSFYYLFQIIIIITFYILMCKFLLKHLSLLKKQALEKNDLSSLAEIKVQRKRLLGQGFIIVFVDCLTFLPNMITQVMRLATGYVRPPIVDVFTNWSLTVLPIINPVITLWLVPEVNAEFYSIYFIYKTKFKIFFKDLGNYVRNLAN